MAKSDRALRRLVAKLGTMAPDDVEDILEQLDGDQGRRVRHLLGEYLGVSVEATRPLQPRDLGLSPWLAERLASVERPAFAGDQARASSEFRMTQATGQVLIDCVAALPSLPTPPPVATARGAWLVRLLDRARSSR